MGFKKKESKEEHKEEIKRIIPVDKNNEQFLLGHALNDESVLERIVTEVERNSFLYTNHRALYDTMKYLYDKRLKVTPDSIEAIKKKVDNGLSIKLKYIGELKATFSNSIEDENLSFHITKLKDDKVKDVLMMRLLPDFGKMLIDPKIGIEEISSYLSKIQESVEDTYIDSEFKFVSAIEVNKEHDKELKARDSGRVFMSTGYERLDKMLTDGFSPGKMSIVAGRTGMGKSALLANMFLRLGLCGVPVAFYNFEMGSISMFDRLIAIDANIPLTTIIKERHKLTYDQKLVEKESKEKISKLPIYFYSASTQSLEGIKRDIKLLKSKYGVKVIGFDLFDKIKLKFGSGRNTADVINDALKHIQGFARDIDVHLLLVVQIGRSAEKRKNKRPKLSELKDAGGYEERADNIFFLYRPDYYNQANETGQIDEATTEEIEIIVAKQRQGQANVKCMYEFFPATTNIDESVVTGAITMEEDDGKVQETE